MILQGLVNYYDRLEGTGQVAPEGYSPEKISFAVVLAPGGKVVDVQDLRDHSGRKAQPKPILVPRPAKRTSGVSPNFLWDKTAYVFGRSNASRRTQQEHEAFRNRHIEWLHASSDEGLSALRAFVTKWVPEHFDTAIRNSGDVLDQNVVFRLDGDRGFIHERPAANSLWAAHGASLETAPGLCLITGKRGPIARLHPSIKGVPGAQSSGALMVSFNLDAFASYGHEQGANAPVSERAAHAYGTALNALLARNAGVDPKTRRPKWTNRVQIGDTTTLFWAEAAGGADAAEAAKRAEQAETVFAAIADPPTDDEEAAKLRNLLSSVEQGRPLEAIAVNLHGDTRFFILGLSPNAARLSVRFFLRSTLGELVARAAEHFQDLSLEPPAWTIPPSAWWLMRETAAQHEADNVSPGLAGEVARAIFTGGRYPRALLAQTLMRIRADGEIRDLRVAIIKACLARAHRFDAQQNRPAPEEDIPMSLDRNESNAGYRLGRLFYVLENAQRMGIGRVNATIRDKFYSSASANPARVFPLLLRGAQDHIAAVRNKRGGGLAFWLDGQIAEIVGGLPASGPFPSTLRLEDQGRFVVGYYHQRNAAKTEGKDAEELPATDEEE